MVYRQGTQAALPMVPIALLRPQRFLLDEYMLHRIDRLRLWPVSHTACAAQLPQISGSLGRLMAIAHTPRHISRLLL
jgi:hypothetical protein